jgi:hypothetical protein
VFEQRDLGGLLERLLPVGKPRRQEEQPVRRVERRASAEGSGAV